MNNGIIDITIQGATRTGGAVVTNQTYKSGSFRMVSSSTATSGVCLAMWSFFYADGGSINNEIDIEFFGGNENNNNVYFSSYTSESNVTSIHDRVLPYAINDGKFHEYRFDWYSGVRVEYYVDGVLFATITSNVPVESADETKNMNIWLGAWCPSWAGNATTEESHMYIKSFTYTPFANEPVENPRVILNAEAGQVLASCSESNLPVFHLMDENGVELESTAYTYHFEYNEIPLEAGCYPTASGYYSMVFELIDDRYSGFIGKHYLVFIIE